MKGSLTLMITLLAWPVTAQDDDFSSKERKGNSVLKGQSEKNGTQSQTEDVLAYMRGRINRQNDAWFHDGDFVPVIENQEILVQLDPQDEDTWSSLVWMYQNIEDPQMEWLTAKRFASANPTYSDSNYYEALFLFRHRMYAKIPALLEPAIKFVPPADPNCYRLLAHSYTRMGYLADSLRVWDAYIKFKPDDAQAKVNRKKVADILHKTG